MGCGSRVAAGRALAPFLALGRNRRAGGQRKTVAVTLLWNGAATAPQLGLPPAECCLRRSVLPIAKLDRLARDAHFLLGQEKAGVKFVTTDMPYADRLTVGVRALVAKKEARIRAALAAAKA